MWYCLVRGEWLSMCFFVSSGNQSHATSCSNLTHWPLHCSHSHVLFNTNLLPLNNYFVITCTIQKLNFILPLFYTLYISLNTVYFSYKNYYRWLYKLNCIYDIWHQKEKNKICLLLKSVSDGYKQTFITFTDLFSILPQMDKCSM